MGAQLRMNLFSHLFSFLLLVLLGLSLADGYVYRPRPVSRPKGRGSGALANGHGIERGFGGGYTPGSSSSGAGYNDGKWARNHKRVWREIRPGIYLLWKWQINTSESKKKKKKKKKKSTCVDTTA